MRVAQEHAALLKATAPDLQGVSHIGQGRLRVLLEGLSWRREVMASNAEGVFAESSSNCTDREGPDAARGGASSTITCTLVPPMPSELMPARRGVSRRGQGDNRVLT